MPHVWRVIASRTERNSTWGKVDMVPDLGIRGTYGQVICNITNVFGEDSMESMEEWVLQSFPMSARALPACWEPYRCREGIWPFPSFPLGMAAVSWQEQVSHLLSQVAECLQHIDAISWSYWDPLIPSLFPSFSLPHPRSLHPPDLMRWHCLCHHPSPNLLEVKCSTAPKYRPIEYRREELLQVGHASGQQQHVELYQNLGKGQKLTDDQVPWR